MAGPIVGEVKLKVRPDLKGFRQDAERQAKDIKPIELDVDDRQLDQAGKKLDEITQDREVDVTPRVDTKKVENDLTSAFNKSKQDVFSKSLQPKVKPTIDSTEFNKRFSEVVRTTKEVTINAKIDAESVKADFDALAKVLRKRLQGNLTPSTASGKIDLDVDVRKAKKAVRELEKDMRKRIFPKSISMEHARKEFDRTKTVYGRLQKVFAKAPTPQIDKAFIAKLVEANRKLSFAQEKAGRQSIAGNLRIHAERTKREAEQVQGVFDRISGAVRRATEPLNRFNNALRGTKAASVVDGKFHDMMDRLRSLGEDSHIRLRVSVEAENVKQQIQKIKNRLSGGDSSKTTGQLKQLDVLRQRLDSGGVSQFADSIKHSRRELEKANPEMRKFVGFGAVLKKTKPISGGIGPRKIFGLTRTGWIASAIAALAAPAIQAVSGAIAALPALGLSAAAALGATALGFDGIKEAAKAAAPSLESVKASVSGTFESRLTPQFSTLGKTLERLEPGFNVVAHGMSDFSQGLVDAVSAGRGFSNINSILGNTGSLFSSLKPFAQSFTEGILEAGAAGSRTFPKLAQGMNRFGENFKHSVQELSDNGVLQQAIESTYTVVGSATTNIGRIIRSGLETFTPDVAASIDKLFTGIADGIDGLLPIFSEIGSGVFDAAGELFSELGDIGRRIGPGAVQTIKDIASGLTDLISVVGDLTAEPLGLLFDALGSISPGIPAIIKGLTDGVSEAQTNMSSLEASVQSLGDEMDNLGSKKIDTSGFWSDFQRGLTDMRTSLGKEVEGIMSIFNSLEAAMGLPGQTKEHKFAIRLEETGISIDDFMSRFDRIKSLGLKATNIEMVIETSLRRTNGPGDLEADIQEMVSKIENVSKLIKVDLSPQIELAKNVTSDQQLWQLGNQIADAFANNTLGSAPKPKVDIEPEVNISSDMATAVEPAKQSLAQAFEGVGQSLNTTVSNEINQAMTQVDTAVTESASQIGTKLGDALGGIDIPTEGLGDRIGNAIKNEITTSLGTIPDAVTQSLSGLADSVTSSFNAVTDAATNAGNSAKDGFMQGMNSMKSEAVSAAQSLASGVRGALVMDLTGSGTAVGATFAAGIRSQIGNVRAAAQELASAARANFPNSPAKEGPFSGSGWIEHSGDAVGETFAKGLIRSTKHVRNAAQGMVGVARDAIANAGATLEGTHRDEIDTKTRLANAKKISKAIESYDKQVAKSKEDHAKRVAEWEKKPKKKGSKSKGPEYKMPEFKLPELDKPDYTKIDRSFKGYVFGGINKIAENNLKKAVPGAISGAKALGREAITAIESEFGHQPILHDLLKKLDDPTLAARIRKVIHDSKIAEVPLNFVISNLSETKRLLGMGDGVISRAIDQAVEVDWTKREEDPDKDVPAIHYHVLSVDEAMRIEEVRKRQAMSKKKV